MGHLGKAVIQGVVGGFVEDEGWGFCGETEGAGVKDYRKGRRRRGYGWNHQYRARNRKIQKTNESVKRSERREEWMEHQVTDAFGEVCDVLEIMICTWDSDRVCRDGGSGSL